jgi:predicted dehydrogenase
MLCSGKTKIGKVFSIINQAYGFKRRNDWQTLMKYGGGLLNNHLTHIIDSCLYILNDTVKDVLCDMQHTTDSGNCEDHVVMLMKMKKGVSVNLSVSTSCNADAPAWIFMGLNGTVSVFKNRAEMRYFDPKKYKKLKALDQRAAQNRQYGNEEVLKWYTKELPVKGDNIGNYYDNIVSVLRKRGTMVVKPESVVEMTRVIEICREQNPGFKF